MYRCKSCMHVFRLGHQAASLVDGQVVMKSEDDWNRWRYLMWRPRKIRIMKSFIQMHQKGLNLSMSHLSVADDIYSLMRRNVSSISLLRASSLPWISCSLDVLGSSNFICDSL